LSEKCPFDLWYLLAVLNSRPAEYLYRKTTVPKANGFLIYKTMFLNTLRVPLPETAKEKSSAARLSELAKRIQDCSARIATLDRVFDDSLQAALPLLDENNQSFKSDYYEIPDYWKVRHLVPSGALSLTDPVVGIRFTNEVTSVGGTYVATSLLTISYQSERNGTWKRIVEMEAVDEHVRMFILMAARRFFRENSRRRTWKLNGSKASQRTVDIVLESIALPTWGLLHGSTSQIETSLKKISQLMQAFRATAGGQTNPSVLEAERKSLDQEIDEITFDLYRMDAEEKKLVLNSQRE
jgi:hypothetical protein